VAGVELRDDVDLVTAVVVVQVVQGAAALTDRRLRPELGDDERLQQAPEQVGAATARRLPPVVAPADTAPPSMTRSMSAGTVAAVGSPTVRGNISTRVTLPVFGHVR